MTRLGIHTKLCDRIGIRHTHVSHDSHTVYRRGHSRRISIRHGQAGTLCYLSYLFTKLPKAQTVDALEVFLPGNLDKNRMSFQYDLVYINYSLNPKFKFAAAEVICPLSFTQ